MNNDKTSILAKELANMREDFGARIKALEAAQRDQQLQATQQQAKASDGASGARSLSDAMPQRPSGQAGQEPASKTPVADAGNAKPNAKDKDAK